MKSARGGGRGWARWGGGDERERGREVEREGEREEGEGGGQDKGRQRQRQRQRQSDIHRGGVMREGDLAEEGRSVSL